VETLASRHNLEKLRYMYTYLYSLSQQHLQ
jgi:hypothetical protein